MLLTQIKRKQARLKKTIERETNKYPSNSTIQKHTLLDGTIQITINTSKMRTFERCSKSTTKTLKLFYSISRNYGLNKAIHSAVTVLYDARNHIIISAIGRNAETIATIEKALLYQEHKFLPRDEQKCKVSMPKMKKRMDDGLFRKTIQFIAAPPIETHTYRNKAAPKVYDHYSIDWDTNTATETIDSVDLRSKETLTQPETDSVVKNCSDLEITKEEKMKIEYGTNLINDQTQITKMEMDMLSKHFTGKTYSPKVIRKGSI
jgi:hypothetical protein